MKRTCNDCVKLRTPACINPEDCVQHGYKHFATERRGLTKHKSTNHTSTEQEKENEW